MRRGAPASGARSRHVYSSPTAARGRAALGISCSIPCPSIALNPTGPSTGRGVPAMVSKSSSLGNWCVVVLVGVLALTPLLLEGQAVLAPSPSALFRPVTENVTAPSVAIHSVSKPERVQAAVTWGAIGALVGLLISSDADGSAIPRAPAVIGLAIAGVLGGLLTGGKNDD